MFRPSRSNRKEKLHKRTIPLPKILRAVPQPYYLTIFTMVKNEGKNLKEWIAFHRLVGADHFFIYDNGSTDDTAELLARYQEQGIATVIPWPAFFPWTERAGVDAREAALAHSITAYGHQCRWMMVIDVDEFVFPSLGDNLAPCLSTFEDLPAIALPWHMFGHSGHVTPPDGLVIENYTQRAALPASEPLLSKYKSVFDPTRVRSPGNHRCVLDDGELIYTQQRNVLRAPEWKLLEPDPRDPILLNHYYTKSVNEFEEKISRLSPTKKSRASIREIRRNAIEASATEDMRIQRFVPKLRELMLAFDATSKSKDYAD